MKPRENRERSLQIYLQWMIDEACHLRIVSQAKREDKKIWLICYHHILGSKFAHPLDNMNGNANTGFAKGPEREPESELFDALLPNSMR